LNPERARNLSIISTEVHQALQDPEAFGELSPGAIADLVNKAEILFRVKVETLRPKQQRPYVQHFTPSTPEAAYQRIETLARVGRGILLEIHASDRSRDPDLLPAVLVTLPDAVHLSNLLKASDAQYPDDAQQAVRRLHDMVKGRMP
jgi:hypothetical protein